MAANSNIKQNLVSQLFIEHSINTSVYESVTSHIFNSAACQIYQALKDRFSFTSLSLVVYHANIIFINSSDPLDNITDEAIAIAVAIQNLENQLGNIDSEMITTLDIYLAVPSMHRLITPAIDTFMVTNLT
ncbi:hypothetical protein O181_013808 [Austropuccinia psidii MF-1]|uniref:Uncharacterized protein n=1 Tax=Austropuccinia psidii MF-1 TaxID=1389203 RepID=A0A9Q3BZF6_9BASI|nr:hypothetical protein [Austropuccinia psidii MF-1]